jgi:hypothetical protein
MFGISFPLPESRLADSYFAPITNHPALFETEDLEVQTGSPATSLAAARSFQSRRRSDKSFNPEPAARLAGRSHYGVAVGSGLNNSIVRA